MYAAIDRELTKAGHVDPRYLSIYPVLRIRIRSCLDHPDPDPYFKNWVRGPGSGKKWTGSATLFLSIYLSIYLSRYRRRRMGEVSGLPTVDNKKTELWSIHRLIGWSADWSINQLVNWSIDGLMDWLIDLFVDWSIDLLIDWSIDRLIDWSIDRLIDWLFHSLVSLFNYSKICNVVI